MDMFDVLKKYIFLQKLTRKMCLVKKRETIFLLKMTRWVMQTLSTSSGVHKLALESHWIRDGC